MKPAVLAALLFAFALPAHALEPVPPNPVRPEPSCVCREALVEDASKWTLITLKFTGDPQLESRPWKASRRLMLMMKDARLPAYNQNLPSKGKLVEDAILEQLPGDEVRLNMKVAANIDVTVYKRRTAGSNTTEYAVLFEVPPDPAAPGGGSLGWPVHGRLSSKFGWRLHPILHEHRMHSGIDIAVPEGTPIHAAQGGRVVYSALRGGAGLCVIIEHGGGRRTSYAHCSKLKVKEGDTVTQDQVLALAGSTGLSTGPHVHFSITQNGEAVDPMGALGAIRDGHKDGHQDDHKASARPKKKSSKKAKSPTAPAAPAPSTAPSPRTASPGTITPTR